MDRERMYIYSFPLVLAIQKTPVTFAVICNFKCKFFSLFHIVCLNSKFPPPVELCWHNKKNLI
jgi:hypothetical protein